MTAISREFQIFVKPVGAECNLRCTYCYYLGKKNPYPGHKQFLMSDEILENYIIQHIEASTEPAISFSWHGGEPLLAGIDFFRKIVAFQRKHKPAGRTVINGIQTNGILLNDRWCSFLLSENFNVGISIDGPEELHDLHRVTRTRIPTFRKVLRGYNLLKKHGITTEILCVVNAANVKFPLLIYNFFKELGAKYITFLPLVETPSGEHQRESPNSVPATGFGEFLIAIFDEWVEKDIGNIKIQIFEEVARTAFNLEHTLCIFKENCGGVPVVEYNGDFYSCDHFVDSTHLIGSIKNSTLSGLLDSENQKAFGRDKSRLLPRYCHECEVKQMCNGECPKNRFLRTPEGDQGLNYLCRGYRLFFNHCIPFVEAIRVAWKIQNSV